jgi:putative FmdB family regulatory protein
MPIYEYRCRACGFEKEYLQKLADAPIEVCESCGQATMSKLVSAAGFQLKGSGWYVTDFKNAGAKPKPAAESDKKEAGKGSETGTESEAGKGAGAGKESTAGKESNSGSAEGATAPQSGADVSAA